jgi:hypothetical protein
MCLLALLLGYMSHNLLTKGLAVWRAESAKLLQRCASSSGGGDAGRAALARRSLSSDANGSRRLGGRSSDEPQELSPLYNEVRVLRRLPPHPIPPPFQGSMPCCFP